MPHVITYSIQIQAIIDGKLQESKQIPSLDFLLAAGIILKIGFPGDPREYPMQLFPQIPAILIFHVEIKASAYSLKEEIPIYLAICFIEKVIIRQLPRFPFHTFMISSKMPHGDRL